MAMCSGRNFAIELCEKLGLEPNRTGDITIYIPVTGVVTVEAQIL